MDQTPTKNRMLTPLEHRFLNAPNARVSFIVQVEGIITENMLRKALEKACELHPILTAKIHYDENHRSWLEFARPNEIDLRIESHTSENQWESEIRAEFEKYSDPTEKSLIRFVLLKGDNTSEIILVGNHAICDGMSFKFLTRDILSFLADPDKEMQPIFSPPMNHDYVSGLKPLKGLVKVVAKKIQDGWAENPAFFESKHFKSSHMAFWRNYRYNLIHKRLTKEQTQQFIDKCRKEGITVNTAINVAFRAALDQFDGYKEHRDNISVAVNIRNDMKVSNNEFYGFAVSSIRIKFKYDFKKNFWDNAKKFQKIASKKLKKKTQLADLAGGFILDHAMNDAILVGGMGYLINPEEPGYADSMKFRNDDANVMIKIMKKKGFMTIGDPITGIVSTNLGRMNIPSQYGNFKLTSIIFVPSAHPIMEIVPGINTINGRLDLTLGSYSKIENDQTDKLNELLNIALNFLL